MAKITDMQIQKNNKSRANVFIDGEFAFALEMLTVMKLGLKIGQDVTASQLNEAVFDSEKSVAFDKALGYLGRGSKTVKQMRDYLTGKGYSHKIVTYVVDKLQDYKYLDDIAYAKAYAEQNSSNKGYRRIKQELVQRGISQTLADESAVQDAEDSQQNATVLAQKYLRNKPCDVKTLAKLQRYLVGRGYNFDVVNSVVRSFKPNWGDTDDD